MFSIFQDKTDFKEEDEKPFLGMADDLDEIVESENQPSFNPDLAELQKPIIEEIEDTEKEIGTEEVIESDKVGKTSIIYFIARIIIYNLSIIFRYIQCFFKMILGYTKVRMIVAGYTTDQWRRTTTEKTK